MSRPPSKGDFWRAFAAVTILPINGSQKAIFGCLIDHANPKTGLCYPSEALIAAETGHPIRTVERAVAGLLLTPYLSRKQRPQSSNDYAINFDVLLKAWDAYKGRGAAYRASKAGDQETVTETVTDRSRKAKSSPSKVADQRPWVVCWRVSSGHSSETRAASLISVAGFLGSKTRRST